MAGSLQIHLGKAESSSFAPAATGTTYGGAVVGSPAFETTEANGTHVWAVDGVLSNLLVTLTTAPGAGKGWTFTLRKNGVDTALVATIADAAVSGRDTTHSVAVVAGDRLTLKTVPAGTPSVAALLVTVAIEFTSTTPGESGYAGQALQAPVSASAARFQGVFRMNNGWSTTTSGSAGGSARTVAAAAGTLTALYVLLTVAPGAGKSYTFAIYKNAVRQDGTGGTPDTQVVITGASATTGSATFALSAAPGDLFTLECLPAGTPAATRPSAAVRFLATTPGESQFCGTTSSSAAASATRYVRIPGASAPVWTGTESDEVSSLVVSGITPFYLRGFQMRIDTAPGAGKRFTFDLRRNLGSPAGTPTVAILDAATSGADPTGQLGFTDGDTVDLRAVPTGTPTVAAGYQWGFIQSVGPAAAAETVQPFVWGPV